MGDVAVAPGAEVVALCELTAEIVPPDARLREVPLPFELDRRAFGVELRVRTTGTVTLSALLHIAVEPDER